MSCLKNKIILNFLPRFIEIMSKRRQDALLSWCKKKKSENVDQTLQQTSSNPSKDTHSKPHQRQEAPDVTMLDQPVQTYLEVFPPRGFGKDKNGKEVKRSFNSSWYQKYKWIHYDSSRDAVFCFTCMKAVHGNLLSSTKAEETFTRVGFNNWKKALEF